MVESASARWLLLLHQLPPQPAYLRVKVWRRLQRLGAVALKASVYALPASAAGALEDFQWVAREIEADGGEATVFEARLLEGLTDEGAEALFRAARDADYAQLAEEARQLRGEDAAALGPAVRRLRKRLTEVVELDFFGAAGRESAEGLLSALEQRAARAQAEVSRHVAVQQTAQPVRGRTWVTRKGIHVDRMASAWLIRRFIDPDARFRFVAGKGYRPEDGELRFDMFDGEYTHEGDLCTFEVLLERFGLEDRALAALGELVHDIDLKDEKFGRPETAGFERLVAGIALGHAEDEVRLARASAVLDDLYTVFSKKPVSPRK